MKKSQFVRSFSTLAALYVATSLPGQQLPATQESAAPTQSLEQVPIELNPFVVTTEKDRGYIATNAITATRINTAIKDLPLQMGILNEAYLKDLDAQTITEAMKFSAYFDGDVDNGSGNRIRGMEAMFDGNPNRNGSGVNSPGASSSLENMTSVDRIEVFKGPSSIINGAALPGGSLNVVTKRARWKDGGKILAAVASLDELRGSFEYNKVIAKDKLAVLGAIGYRKQETDDYGHRDFKDEVTTYFLATTWRYSRQGEVALDVQYDESTVPDLGNVWAYRTFGTNGGNVPYIIQFPGFPQDYYYRGGDTFRKNTRWLPTASWSHRLGENLSWQVRYASQDRSDLREYRNDSLLNSNPATPINPALGRKPYEVRANWSYIDRKDGYNEWEARGLYEFKFKSLVSKLSVNYKIKEYTYRFAQLRDRNPATPGTNRDFWLPMEQLLATPSAFYALDRGLPTDVTYFNEFIDEGPVNDRTLNLIYQGKLPTKVGTFHVLGGVNKGEQKRYGGRRLFTNGVENPATVGIQNVLSNERDSEWLPSVGMVYQPNEALAIYAAANKSYTFQFRRNSFQELLPNTGGKTLEIGVKLESFGGKIVGSIGYFDSTYYARALAFNNYPVFNAVLQDGTIIKTQGDQARWDPVSNPITSGAGQEWFSTGEFGSKGFDADLVLTPFSNWQTTFSYLYADAKVLFDSNASHIGRRENNNAKHTLALFTNYQFSNQLLKGFTIGCGYRWSSKRVESYQVISNVTTLYEKDGANTLDLFAKYKMKVRKLPVEFQLNVQNLLREDRFFGPVPGTQSTTRQLYTFTKPVLWRLTTTMSF